MYKSQKGSSVVYALLLLVIVGIIGGTGWYVWNSNKNTNNSLNKASQATSAKPSAKKNTETAEQVKYYDIKELSIKIKLTPDTQDLLCNVTANNRGIQCSLESFVTAVNEAGATILSSTGENDCERLVGVSLFKPSERYLLEDSPVQTIKFDKNGEPLSQYKDNVFRLADGRYALITHIQWSCYDGPKVNQPNLLEQLRTDTIKKLDNLLRYNLTSY